MNEAADAKLRLEDELLTSLNAEVEFSELERVFSCAFLLFLFMMPF